MAKGRCSDPEKEAERARKISAARQRRLAELGYLNSPETCKKIGEAGRGRTWTAEQREKVGARKRGRRPANFDAFLAAAHAAPRATGENASNWKGDTVGYSGLHQWVRRQKGTPSLCERCGTTAAKRYEWANKSREYRRDLDDWERLCVSCHRKDGNRVGEYPSPKGIPTGRVPRSAFKKGEQRGHRFAKGHMPANKYLEPRSCVQCGQLFQPLDASWKYCGYPCYWESLKKPKAVEIKET